MSLLRAVAPLLALVLFGLVLPGDAHAGGQGERMAAEELGLSEAQLAQMKEIQFTGKTARIAIEARLDIARAELRHALGAATLDDALVARSLEAANGAGSELLASRTEQAVALRKVLTPEQWAKAAVHHDDDRRDDRDDDRRDDRDDDRRDDRDDDRRDDRDDRRDDDDHHARNADGPDCDRSHCQECAPKATPVKQRRRTDPAEPPKPDEQEDYDRWGDD